MKVLPGFTGELEHQRLESVRIAESLTGRKLKISEVDRFWYKYGLKFILKKPLKYLRLLFSIIGPLLVRIPSAYLSYLPIENYSEIN